MVKKVNLLSGWKCGNTVQFKKGSYAFQASLGAFQAYQEAYQEAFQAFHGPSCQEDLHDPSLVASYPEVEASFQEDQACQALQEHRDLLGPSHREQAHPHLEQVLPGQQAVEQ